MEINLEKVDEIIRRKKVSYQAAKQALEENNGDVLEALASLDRGQPKRSGLGDTIKQIIRRLNQYKISFEKDAKQLLELPSTIVIALSFFFFPIVLGVSILLMFLGYSVRVRQGVREIIQVPALDLADDLE